MIKATFNNISVTSWMNRSTRRKPPTCRKSLTNLIINCCIEYTSPSAGFELTTSVLIGSYCAGSCKANYHTMTTTTVPSQPIQLPSLVLYVYIMLLKRPISTILKSDIYIFRFQYCRN